MIDALAEYKEALDRAKMYGKELAGIFEEALKPVIPDINVKIDLCVHGVDYIDFESDMQSKWKQGAVWLPGLVKKACPQITPITRKGIYISVEQGEKVRGILENLLNNEEVVQ
jgi:hypothetical protein